MNHLGGMEGMVCVEWFTRPISMVYLVYLTCGWPPRNKEIGDVLVTKLQVQPLGIMGSAWII